MFLKLAWLLFVDLAADKASSSGKCEVKNPRDPDLDKLSGLWYMVGTYPDTDSLFRSRMMEFKKDGANFTVTMTFDNTWTRSATVVVGVDEENQKVMKPVANSEDPYVGDDYFYLPAAVYDRFSIIYNCFRYNRVHDFVIVLSRSKYVDEDTRRKITEVLLEYPQLKELTDKFDHHIVNKTDDSITRI